MGVGGAVISPLISAVAEISSRVGTLPTISSPPYQAPHIEPDMAELDTVGNVPNCLLEISARAEIRHVITPPPPPPPLETV